jgi:hypothetical protein
MVSQHHLLLDHPFRLVAAVPRTPRGQCLADGNPGYVYPLHDGPHDGQATGFGGEGINLVGSLPDEARKSFQWHWLCE